MNFQSTYIVLCNFSQTGLELNKLNGVSFLSLWIGERIKIIAEQGLWCYGHYENQPEKTGLFPKSHIQEIEDNTPLKNLSSDANHVITEITETVKIWWRCIKKNYASNEYSTEKTEKFIQLIKDFMIIRNKISSGNVPTGELKEIQLVIIFMSIFIFKVVLEFLILLRFLQKNKKILQKREVLLTFKI